MSVQLNTVSIVVELPPWVVGGVLVEGAEEVGVGGRVLTIGGGVGFDFFVVVIVF